MVLESRGVLHLLTTFIVFVHWSLILSFNMWHCLLLNLLVISRPNLSTAGAGHKGMLDSMDFSKLSTTELEPCFVFEKLKEFFCLIQFRLHDT